MKWEHEKYSLKTTTEWENQIKEIWRENEGKIAKLNQDIFELEKTNNKSIDEALKLKQIIDRLQEQADFD